MDGGWRERRNKAAQEYVSSGPAEEKNYEYLFVEGWNDGRADALEEVENDLLFWKIQYEAAEEEIARLQAQIRALKGH